MQSFRFWNEWSTAERRTFWFLIVLSIAIIGLFLTAYFQYPSFAFIYEPYQEIKLLEIPLRSFVVGLSTIEVTADNLLLYETFSGSALQPIAWIFYTFIFCLIVGLTIFLSFVTTLKRYAFFAGLGFFALIIVSFHLEALALFGIDNRASTIITILVYCLAAYIFHSYRADLSFNFRLLTFAAITVLLAVVIFFSSNVQTPFLYLAVNGLFTGIIIALLFILMTAHEIVASFVTLVSVSKNPSNSARHFYLLTGIYLANLIFTYLIREQYLKWDILTVNSFLLLLISALIGLWGLQKRKLLYEEDVESISSITYLYLAFCLITFATLSFIFSTNSTTMMDAFNDIVLFAQLGYGIIFTVYVTANFTPMMMANLPVYKILYKPDTMPFFTFRTMGLIATFAFLSYSYPLTSYIDRATAAYFNAYGNLFQIQGDDPLAEAYYKKSVLTRTQNHHAHYSLATLYYSQLDPFKAIDEYNTIITTTPTEISYLNLSEIYQEQENYAATGKILTAGLRQFPTSGILLNAQALNYYQLGVLDSSLQLFQKSRRQSFTKDAAETNLFAASAQLRIRFPVDSLFKLFSSTDAGTQANALALANVQQSPLDITFSPLTDTILTVKVTALLANQLTNQHHKIDTAWLRQIVETAKKPSNENFKEFLLASAAQAYYATGMVKQGIELLLEVSVSTGQGKYYNLIGTWMLEQDNPRSATMYFRKAKESQIKSADFNEALAWMEADSLEKANGLWQFLMTTGNSTSTKEPSQYATIIQSNQTDILEKSDLLKYGFCRYRIPLADSIGFDKILKSISDEELYAMAVFDRCKKWFDQDEPSLAISSLSKLKDASLKNKKLTEDISFLNLLLAAEINDFDYIQARMQQELPIGYINEKIYLQALLDERQNKLTEAEKKFAYLANSNNQFCEGLLAAANYFAKDKTDLSRSHSILVTGLLAKPYSIKLLKAYSKLSAKIGFEDETKQALEKLKKILPTKSWEAFIEQNSELRPLL